MSQKVDISLKGFEVIYDLFYCHIEYEEELQPEVFVWIHEFMKRYQRMYDLWTKWTSRFCDREIQSIRTTLLLDGFASTHLVFFAKISEILLEFPEESLDYPAFAWVRLGATDEIKGSHLLLDTYRRYIFMKDVETWTRLIADDVHDALE